MALCRGGCGIVYAGGVSACDGRACSMPVTYSDDDCAKFGCSICYSDGVEDSW